MPRRILYVSRTWAMGGAQSVLLALIRGLPREEFEIVVAPFDSGEEPDRVFAAAAREAGATLSSPIPWHGLRSWRSASAAISGIVREQHIELLHSHENMSNTLIGMTRGRYAIPAIATAFGWWDLNLKLKAYYAFERRFVLPRFDAVYTVSHQMAGKIERGGTEASRTKVIHTGLDAAAWARRGRRDAMRRKLGIDPSALVVGAVGRVSPEKGYDHLLRAMTRLSADFPNLVALLAGTGPDIARLHRIAGELGLSDRVVMPGYVQDAAETLEAIDVAVLPSVLEEGFPTASMEAQAAGLPIVASDIGGTRETIQDGVTGILCPPGDELSLAEALRQVLSDQDLRNRMGLAAQQRIASDFTQGRMLSSMASLYRSVLAGVDD